MKGNMELSESVERKAEAGFAGAPGWAWSAELPTETGWYWFRAFKCEKLREQQKCIYVEMHPTLGGMMRDGRLPTDMEAWPGEWCGPIPEPVTPNDPDQRPGELPKS